MVRWLGLFSLALFAGLGYYLAPLQPNVVGLQLTFNAHDFQRVLQEWGPAGLELFRSHLPVDGVLMLAYGAFGYLAVAQTAWFAPLYRGRSAPMALLLLMPLAALADCLENTFHWVLTATGAPQPAWLYAAAGIVATLKFMGIGLFAVMAVVARLRRSV